MEGKEQFIQELVKLIEQKGKEVQASGEPAEMQLPKVDVMLDVVRFLDHYDENVKVLNDYWRKKRYAEKFKGDR